MFDKSFGAALLESAKRHQDRPALWAGGRHFTYAELFSEGARIATALREAGVQPGDFVAILSHRTVTAYASVLGALLAGCTYIPLNASFPRERNTQFLRATGPKVIILDAKCASKIDSYVEGIASDAIVLLPEQGSTPLPGRRNVVADEMPQVDFNSFVMPQVERDALAYIVFTSGTTGPPKGVTITHANVAAYLSGISEVVPHTADDRLLQISDLTFDVSVHDFGLGWLNGGQLFAVPELTGPLAPRLIAKFGITSLMIAPSSIGPFVRLGLPMPSLRVSMFCGEALPVPSANAWLKAAPNTQLYNIYGPTEATILFSWHRFDPVADAEFDIVPIGRPFSSQRMAVVGPDMEELPAGELGEILLSGSQLTGGYWNAPDTNAAKFVEIAGRRWYRTGDIGKVVEPHGYLFAGRVDRQIKIYSFRVELQEIEGALRRVTGRHEVAAVPWPKVAEGSYDGVVAFIAGEELDSASLRLALKPLIAGYAIPERIIFLDQLPLNPNGKVDYKLLAQQLETDHAPATTTGASAAP